MEKGKAVLFVLVGLAYIISPDLLPGPLDDVIVAGLCAFAAFRKTLLAGKD